MKITSIDIISPKTTKADPIHPVITRIHTDEGLTGWGEGGIAIIAGDKAVFELIREYAPLLIGKNPLDINVLWDRLFYGTFWAMSNGPVVMSAISALDTALWDIKAKSMNLPLYQALGGAYRDKIHVYASQLHFGWGSQTFHRIGKAEEYRQSAENAKAAGYDAVKINLLAADENGNSIPNLAQKNLLSPEMMRRAEERLKVVREVMGPDGIILIENNGNTDVNTALQLAHMAEPYGITYIEEACMPLSADNCKKIAEGTTIPIAAGERNFTRWGFLPFFKNGSLSVAQPDIGNCGGVTECMRIAQLAQLYDVSIQSHACNSPLSVAVALHVEAAIPNFIIHEHHLTNTFRVVKDMGLYEYEPVNSYVDVPQLPGIGQELSEKALRDATIVTVTA